MATTQTQTLMSPSEVVDYSGIKKLNNNLCDFKHIYQVEYEQARKCIGVKLWKAMIAALVDYSATPAWASGTTYNLDDLVKFKGLIYKATTTTETQPPTIPDWELAPKFEGSCAATYETIFCDFLAPFLAHKILARRIPYIRTMITSMGTIEYNGQDFETTDQKDYTSLVNAINKDAGIAWGNLMHYMDEEDQKALKDSCLDGWPPYETEDCSNGSQCNTRHHRTGVYRFG